MLNKTLIYILVIVSLPFKIAKPSFIDNPINIALSVDAKSARDSLILANSVIASAISPERLVKICI